MKQELKLKVLNEAEITKAQELLFEVYCEEMGWAPQLRNPSGLMIRTAANKSKLVDNYNNAHWLGVFDKDSLVGTIRVIDKHRTELEISRYSNIPARANAIEVNRLAIRRGYRDGRVCVLLFLGVGNYIRKFGPKEVFATTCVRAVSKSLKKLGFEKLSGKEFKYDPTDLKAVEVLHLKDDRRSFWRAYGTALLGRFELNTVRPFLGQVNHLRQRLARSITAAKKLAFSTTI